MEYEDDYPILLLEFAVLRHGKEEEVSLYDLTTEELKTVPEQLGEVAEKCRGMIAERSMKTTRSLTQ